MSTIKEIIEDIEHKNLCEYACFSDKSKGRDFSVKKDTVRTEFQRDRDRIIHSKSFRRLMHKTQCFLSPEGDHYRTRLTHTLEVSQIARTCARALKLNEDLTEAIALGHDLGHTPFGHAGERILNKICKDGFTHNAQSLRVVEIIEKDGKGLNLTKEVRDGILCHTGEQMPITREGEIIRYADKIAYINHDIDDAVRAGILTNTDIPVELRNILGENHPERINIMVNSLINKSQNNFDNGIPLIAMESDIEEATMELRAFMFQNVYLNPVAKSEETRACLMLEELYNYFYNNPDKIPVEYRKYMENNSHERAICDYLACMTDRYAVEVFENTFIPKMWALK